METLLVNTAQNVKVEYKLASVGSRIIAVSIDLFFIFCYLLLCMYIVFELLTVTNDSWLMWGIYSFITLPALFYFFVLETFLEGQTLGKKIMKIKVVKLDGGRATVYEYFIRWTMGILDIWTNSGCIGLLSIILTKKSQRLGDIAANTTVINIKPKLSLIETVYEKLQTDYQIRFSEVQNLTDRDINIIKQNFNSALNSNSQDVIIKLSDKIRKTLNIKVDMPAREFVKTIIQDHYHFFKDN